MDIKAWWRSKAEQVMTRSRSGHASGKAVKLRDLLHSRLTNVDDFVDISLMIHDEPVEVYYINTMVDGSNVYRTVMLPLQRAKERCAPEELLPLAKIADLNDRTGLDRQSAARAYDSQLPGAKSGHAGQYPARVTSRDHPFRNRIDRTGTPGFLCRDARCQHLSDSP